MILQEVLSLDEMNDSVSLDHIRDLEDKVLEKVFSDYEIVKLIENLTLREREVAYFISEGWKVSDIATELDISHQRVSQIRAEIKRKLSSSCGFEDLMV